ncbi:MAG: ATP-binding protein, partial [Bacteriovoracia bacterium]
ATHPEQLKEMIDAKRPAPQWVIIDEIQKIPKLLDVIHQVLFDKKIKFALTGSSARKLKRDAANLLAGRAFSYYLYPFSFLELGDQFDLNRALAFGTLPSVLQFDTQQDIKRFLLSYVHTYVKEEVLVEQLVRNIDPFRAFLEVAAQSNTEIINYTTLAKEAGINSKSVERYFSILADTLLGYFLEPYSRSVRERQRRAPKFYFFDCGVVRAISQEINQELLPSTFEYGKLFDQMVICEFFRLNQYYEKNWKFSYLRTGAGVEIDLIIEKSRKEVILVEIKSTAKIHDDHLSALRGLASSFPEAKRYVLCLEKIPRELDGVRILDWKEGIREIFEV